MASATTAKEDKTTATPDATPFAPFSAQGEQLLSGIRKAGAQYVDFYESAVNRAISLERRVAANAKPEWVKTLVDGHVNLVTQVNEVSVSTARDLLK